MLSLDPCSPHLLVPDKENTGVVFYYYYFDFRVALQKIEKNWEQKPSPIPNLSIGSPEVFPGRRHFKKNSKTTLAWETPIQGSQIIPHLR